MRINEFLEVDCHIDFNHLAIMDFLNSKAFSCDDLQETLFRLFHFVRDHIAYDSSYSFNRASTVLITGSGNSLGKACLLAALSRAAKIPAGILLQQIIDMKAPRHLIKKDLETGENSNDGLQWHAVTAALLHEKWYKLDTSLDRWTAIGRKCQVPHYQIGKDALLPERDFDGNANYKIVKEGKIISKISDEIEALFDKNIENKMIIIGDDGNYTKKII